jgi:hypothetical protein
MDNYLNLANRVLRNVRQPLSAREILKVAYESQIVPPDLYGRTQHKTLQARLSTDILKRRLRSEFYRTGPGRFFLRALQNDRSTPEQYKREYVAPIRASQLGKFEVLTAERDEIEDLAAQTSLPFVLSHLGRVQWHYALLEKVRRDPASLPFELAVQPIFNGLRLCRKESSSPTDKFRAAPAVSDFIRLSDWSLFSEDEIGLFDAAYRAVAQNLGISVTDLRRAEPVKSYENTTVLYQRDADEAKERLAIVVELDCSLCSASWEAAVSSGRWQWEHPGGDRNRDPLV